MHGWRGKGLVINLSEKKVKDIELSKEVLKQYIGGTGLGFKLIYDHYDVTLDPFDPRTPLILAVGPLTGSKVFGAARHSIISFSPLTNTIADALSGGFFGVELKFAGYDAVIIEGKSEEPVYIYIEDGTVEIRDAKHLWGRKVSEVIETLTSDLGKKFKIATIGPAGENLVRFACIMNDRMHASGRGGLGAVMGAKKLKAIAVSGSKKVEEADPERLRELFEDVIKIRMTWNPALNRSLRIFGTSALVNLINTVGILPTKNFQKGVYEYAEEISGEALRKRILTGRHSCWNCPVACKRETKTPKAKGDGPEYETIVNLGSMILVKTIEEVAELNYLANEMGLDTISLGGTLACACELSELGKLPEKIEWGNTEWFKEIIVKIAKREGIGNDLAEGSKRLAEKYGAPDVAMQVKGLEIPAYDPRGAFGMALSYGTSYRGACHLRGWSIAFEIIGIPNLVDRFSAVEKPALVAYLQDLAMVYDSLILCQHYGMEFDEEPLAAILSAVTGVEYSKELLLLIGERIWNLARLINVKRGFSGKDDMLPKRLLEPLKEGPAKGRKIPYEEMLKLYYEVRGWDENGIPTDEKLEELGLAR